MDAGYHGQYKSRISGVRRVPYLGGHVPVFWRLRQVFLQAFFRAHGGLQEAAALEATLARKERT